MFYQVANGSHPRNLPESSVQISSDIAAHLQNITPSSNTLEDVHICGTCKHRFSDINLFVEHKRSGCSNSPQNIPSTMVSSLSQPTLGYLTTATTPVSDNGMSSLGQPFLRVILDGGNLPVQQGSDPSQQDLPCEESREPQILRSRLMGMPSEQRVQITVQQPNFHHNSGQMQALVMQHQQQQHSRREFQIDEEDVATLLANQLANEVVNVHEASISSSRSELLSLEDEIIIPEPRDSLDLTSINLSEGDTETLVSDCEQHKQNRSVKDRGRISTTNNSLNVSSSGARELVTPRDKLWGQSNSKFVHDIEVPARVQNTSSLSLAENSGSTTNSNSIVSSTRRKRHDCPVDECTFTTSYLKDLVRHMRTHTGERPFQCDSCQRTFSRGDKLQMHLRIHSGEKPHRCQQCNYATIDSGSLRKHMRIHNDERPYKCQICPYRSRDTSQLTVHLRTHTGDNPFVCPYESCPAAFKTSSDLKRHGRMHTGEKPYSCDLCNYKCAIKSNLRVHVRLNHIEPKSIACNTCDHVATSKRAAKEHEKMHAEEILKCAVCLYSCISPAGMRSHLKIHTQDKPFACKHCSYSCRQQSNLKSHMKKKHLDSRVTKKGKVASKEATVPTKGNSSNRTNGAKSSVHSKPFCVKSHQCTFCDAAFVREDSWRSHMRQHQTQENPTSLLNSNIEEQSNNAVEILSQAAAEVGAACDQERAVAMMNSNVGGGTQEDILTSDSFIAINTGEAVLEHGDQASREDNSAIQLQTNSKDPNRNSFIRNSITEKDNKEQIAQQISQQEILDNSNLQTQPVFLYVQNAPMVDNSVDDSLRNAEILASLNQSGPIFVTGRCGQYLSVPVDQSNSIMEHLAASLQPGMQYVLSGPLESIVGSDATFIQTATGTSTSNGSETSIPIQPIISVHMEKTTVVDDKH